MKEYATRYACRSCGRHTFLPERPLNPTPRPRAGCRDCGRVTAHAPVGSVYK